MADFCKQCAEEHGFPDNDLRGICSEEDTAMGFGFPCICEGCGECVVDHEGACHTHESHTFEYLEKWFKEHDPLLVLEAAKREDGDE